MNRNPPNAQQNAQPLPNMNPVVQHEAMMNQLTQLHTKIDTLSAVFNTRLDTRFNQLHEDIVNTNTRINTLRTRLDGRINTLDAKIDKLVNGLDNRVAARTRNHLAIAINSKFLRGQTMSKLEPFVNAKTATIINDFPDLAGDIALMSRAELESVLLALGYRTLPTQPDDDLRRALEHRVGLLWD